MSPSLDQFNRSVDALFRVYTKDGYPRGGQQKCPRCPSTVTFGGGTLRCDLAEKHTVSHWCTDGVGTWMWPVSKEGDEAERRLTGPEAVGVVTPYVKPELTTAEHLDFETRYPEQHTAFSAQYQRWFSESRALDVDMVLTILLTHRLGEYQRRAQMAYGGDDDPTSLGKSLKWLHANEKAMVDAWGEELTSEARLARRLHLLGLGWTPLHVAKWELVHP